LDRKQAVEAVTASGVAADTAVTRVAIATIMGTAVCPNDTLIVCAAGDYAVETMDTVRAVRA
jgi:hypothetical protein